MASPTQWTWVWVNSRRWWWTERPGLLQSMGSHRVGHDWMTELIKYGFLSGSKVKSLSQCRRLRRNGFNLWVGKAQSLGLWKGMATHPSILAWRIPRTEEPGRLSSVKELQRAGHYWSDWAHKHALICMSDAQRHLKKWYISTYIVHNCQQKVREWSVQNTGYWLLGWGSKKICF